MSDAIYDWIFGPDALRHADRATRMEHALRHFFRMNAPTMMQEALRRNDSVCVREVLRYIGNLHDTDSWRRQVDAARAFAEEAGVDPTCFNVLSDAAEIREVVLPEHAARVSRAADRFLAR